MIVDGVNYEIIVNRKVKDYIFAMAQEEWDSEDFEIWGDYLKSTTFKLKEVDLSNLKRRPELLSDNEFSKDLEKRIEFQIERIKSGQSIKPLVLDGRDMLIFDGYARSGALDKLGKNICLAYVGENGSRNS